MTLVTTTVRFAVDTSHLLAVSEAIDEATLEGINPNTFKMDDRAWRMWELICKQHGTSAYRTEDDVRNHPIRNAHLLAALLLHAFRVCKPKSKDRSMVKPGSALAYPLAIIRVFGRWGIRMPGFRFLSKALDGFKRRYLAFHGPDSLAPRRAENMKFAMVLRMHRIPCDGSVKVGKLQWNDSNHDIFMSRRLNLVLIFTAFRLGEIVGNRSEEIMYLTFASLVWRINGIMVRSPTAEQLRSLRPGRDQALLFPPRSKADQMGEMHCPFPVTLTYQLTELNPTAALRDVELRVGQHVSDRAATPLFGDAAGQVYTHHILLALLRGMLTHCYGAAIALTYSFHSYRSGLATALHAAGVDDAMIQLICRWMCPESLHVYRRMGTREHERLINLASSMNVDAIQSGNVVRVMNDEHYSSLLSDFDLNPAHSRAYADAERQAANPFTRQLSTTAGAPAAVPAEAGPAAAANARPTQRRRTTTPVPTPSPPAATLRPLTASPTVGDALVVPRDMWPTYPCHELGGAGWTVTVVRCHNTARVRFSAAHRTRDGRGYEDELITFQQLRTAG